VRLAAVDLLTPILAVGEADTGPAEPSNVGVGAVVLTVLIAGFLIWVGYLILNSRRRAKRVEETPANLSPWLSDDELETDRVTKVLNAAVVSAAVLAIITPLYFLNEPGRQEGAAEKIAEDYVHEGEHWYEFFSCINCHGPGGGGGAAAFVEGRSGLEVAWPAPSLNDVFYRYDDEEIRHWIEFGRAGTPMPANGLEGGGAMTGQEVDQVMAYLRSIQIPQGQALDEVEGVVQGALDRIDGGEAAAERLLVQEQARLQDALEASDRFAVVGDLPSEIRFLLAGDGSCTDESAAAVGSTCRSEGLDSDRDGITDAAEIRLTEIGAVVDETLVMRTVVDVVDEDGAPVLDEEGNRIAEVVFIQDPSLPNGFGLSLDPNAGFSTTDVTGDPIADLERIEAFLRDLDTGVLSLSIINDRPEVFTDSIERGIAFLEDAIINQAWEVDFAGLQASSGLSADETRRAVGLFNGYCARCHTAGYQAGAAFEQGLATGAWGPSLLDGKSGVQFTELEDQIDFVIRGSVANENYGVNGLGSGRMPAFGQILSREDIALIVALERGL